MKTNVENRYIWFKNEIINVNEAKINVLSPTSQFGLNVFEGIPCYWNDEKKQLYAFRLTDHYNRLLRSAKLGITPAFLDDEKTVSATDRGIATHLLFQFCNLDRLKKEGAEAELSHLAAEKYLSEEDAKIVRIKEVEAFRHSRLIDEMIAAKEMYREFRFNVLLPADIFATPEAKPLYKDETVLVQGVIDCLYRDADGEYHLIDYKTDRLTREQRCDRDAARREMCDRHASQLYYYGLAIERIFGKKPITREVYSLHLGDTLSVVTDEFPV